MIGDHPRRTMGPAETAAEANARHLREVSEANARAHALAVEYNAVAARRVREQMQADNDHFLAMTRETR